MARPLFILGNKRSGTSQLVRVLNLHPQIFVSHESDIAWILYQFHHAEPFRAHPWDSDRGMKVTLELAGHLLRRDAAPAENFSAVEQFVMERGTPWLAAQQKPGLQWLGDKKPMQHTDPKIAAFLLEHFPEARFLHIVRHPFEVVASSDRFNQTADGDFWLGLAPAEKLERWAFHEARVLEFRAAHPGRVHSLRYEDFCRHTETELSAVFAFLGVELDAGALREASRQTRPPARALPKIPGSGEAVRMASHYGYDLEARSGLTAWTDSAYWRAAKKLAG